MKEGRDREATIVEPAPGPEVSRPGPLGDTLLSPSRSRRRPPSIEHELPATDLGSYRLLQWLGGGGMGQVFLAEHRQLSRKVALKVLRKELAHSPEVVRRFMHEAQLVNQIKNEHIVDIHDFGEGPDGLEYFVMELLVGRDLAKARDEDGPFALARAMEIVRQVGSALDAVHARKIIHRDLKPENIFLAQKAGRTDFVKLLDFGLAKLTEAAPGASDGTAIGTLLGTPLYMSPEQAMGLRVDSRTDIYSLGLVLHWMLFDMLPHESEDLESIRKKRMEEPVDSLPAQTVSGEPVPREVAELVVGCLARNPGDRVQTVREVLERLPRPAAAPQVPRDRSRRLRALLIAAAVGMVLAASALALYAATRPPPVEPAAPLPEAAQEDLPPLPTPVSPPAVAPTLQAPAATPSRPPATGPEEMARPTAKAEEPTAKKRSHPQRRRTETPGAQSPEDLIDPFAAH